MWIGKKRIRIISLKPDTRNQQKTSQKSIFFRSFSRTHSFNQQKKEEIEAIENYHVSMCVQTIILFMTVICLKTNTKKMVLYNVFLFFPVIFICVLFCLLENHNIIFDISYYSSMRIKNELVVLYLYVYIYTHIYLYTFIHIWERSHAADTDEVWRSACAMLTSWQNTR